MLFKTCTLRIIITRHALEGPKHCAVAIAQLHYHYSIVLYVEY